MKHKSIAIYVEPNEITTDLHDTKSEALAVCKLLEKDGYGGYRKKFPVKTMVEEVKK